MANTNSPIRRHAVLIGIDAYPERALNSCVADVHKIKACLERLLASVDIQMLTASKSSGPDADTPAEDLIHWPTLSNVVSALGGVISASNPGDLVYIHFSGHGTRFPPAFDLSNEACGDLALVLLTDAQSPDAFLRGPRLAGLMRRMVQNGLVVTLVLDCCFSASVYRDGEESVRYLPCHERTAAPVDLQDDPVQESMHSVTRDASMADNWLLNPDKYAILTACGPHENAKGGFERTEKGSSYGLLSYYLASALLEHGLDRRHGEIHRHLCAKFWELSIPQNPVLYGNENQGFLGKTDSSDITRSISVVEHNENFYFLAGRAHGFRDGDKVTLSAPVSAATCGSEMILVAEIIHAEPLTSQLELLGNPKASQRGWNAELLASSLLAGFCVRLSPTLPFYNEWRDALGTRLIRLYSDGDEVPSLEVVLGKSGDYEILESGQRLVNLPALSQLDTDTTRICTILEHIARYRVVQGLSNDSPSGAFRSSFDITVIRDGEVFGPGEAINVQHEGILRLQIQNLGLVALYVHIYHLGPCWQIKGLLRGSYEVVPPSRKSADGEQEFVGKVAKSVKMTVPPVLMEKKSCNDIIKIFVTSQPTSFSLLELPNVDALIKITSGDRLSHPSMEVAQDWVALNFPIQVLLP